MDAIKEVLQNIEDYKTKDIEGCFRRLATVENILSESDIKNEQLTQLVSLCIADQRKSIQKLGISAQKLLEKQEMERQRTAAMYMREMELWAKGTVAIAGIDEVGRGCVAGPVVAGVVILPMRPKLLHLNDSKKLSANQRERLDEQIREHAIDYAIGEVDAQRIDQIGIVKATFEAMRLAVGQLVIEPDHLLIDAFRIPDLDVPQTNIVGGDGVSAAIAAASIIAKVYRDRIMTDLHHQYPEYGFDNHKGYGTAEHMQQISTYGLSPLHRRSFLKNIVFA